MFGSGSGSEADCPIAKLILYSRLYYKVDSPDLSLTTFNKPFRMASTILSSVVAIGSAGSVPN
jgi:hypothetical protein